MAKYEHDGTLVGRLFAGIANGISNLWNKFTGNQMTDAEREANEFSSNEAAVARQFSHNEAQEQMRFQREMSNTEWQRGVADMRSAGLNPALAYGQGGASAMQGASGSASAPTSVTPSAGSSLSELMQLALLPKQADLLAAQAAKLRADEGKTLKETSWIDALNNSRVQEIASIVRVNEAEINQKDYENALSDAQRLKVLKETSWLDRINEAKTDADKARARLDAAEAAISEFEKEKGHRLGSSELLAVATSIANWLGIGNKDFAELWSDLKEYMKNASDDLKKHNGGQPLGPADNPPWIDSNGNAYTPKTRQ